TIEKSALLAPLFEPDRDMEGVGELTPKMVSLLAARAAGFLSDGDTNKWARLKAIYEGGDTWGSIVASFAEYGRDHDIADEITSDLDTWLRTPEHIRQTIVWDDESRAITTLDNRLHRIPKKRRGEYLLRLLDYTISPFPT